jgi:hypothetical protein
MEKKSPFVKLFITVLIIFVGLIIILSYLQFKEVDCLKYDQEIIIGRKLIKSVDNKLPAPILNFIADHESNSKNCFFPSNKIKFTHFCAEINTGIFQYYEIYSGIKKPTEKKSDIPETESIIKSGSLGNKFYTGKNISNNLFVEKLKNYIISKEINDILIYSNNPPDSLIKITIGKRTYKVITNSKTLLLLKYKILDKNKMNNVQSNILLVYNPILPEEPLSPYEKYSKNMKNGNDERIKGNYKLAIKYYKESLKYYKDNGEAQTQINACLNKIKPPPPPTTTTPPTPPTTSEKLNIVVSDNGFKFKNGKPGKTYVIQLYNKLKPNEFIFKNHEYRGIDFSINDRMGDLTSGSDYRITIYEKGGSKSNFASLLFYRTERGNLCQKQQD